MAGGDQGVTSGWEVAGGGQRPPAGGGWPVAREGVAGGGLEGRQWGGGEEGFTREPLGVATLVVSMTKL